MLNQIINGNCFDVMPNILENSIDLIIFDPPYNIGSDSKLTMIGNNPMSTNVAWGDDGFVDTFNKEDYNDIMEKSAKEFSRILKQDGSIIVFYNRGYDEWLLPLKQAFKYRNLFAFIKRNPIPHIRKNNYRSGFELAMWLSREKYKLNFFSQEEMINVFYGNIGEKVTDHPTEKYKWMIQPLIERHSKIGDTILDPMCGSGTTCAIAKELGRNFIGIELDKNYYEMALNRVNLTIVDDVASSFGN